MLVKLVFKIDAFIQKVETLNFATEGWNLGIRQLVLPEGAASSALILKNVGVLG